jgi:hypothetical protein
MYGGVRVGIVRTMPKMALYFLRSFKFLQQTILVCRIAFLEPKDIYILKQTRAARSSYMWHWMEGRVAIID